jgi:hypothetical protein
VLAVVAAVGLAAQGLPVRVGTAEQSVETVPAVVFGLNLLVVLPLAVVSGANQPRAGFTPTALAAFAVAGVLGSLLGRACPLPGRELASNARNTFLFVSHLGMVFQAFLIHRYSDFPCRAVLVAVIWYGFNDLVDYFVPIVGTPHHTLLPVEPIVNGTVQHVSPAHEIAAVGAVVLTILATVLALRTRQVTVKRI